MKDLQQTIYNQVRKSLMAYLEGKKNLNWILGIIKSTNIDQKDLLQIFENLNAYGDHDKYSEAYSSCKEQGLLGK